MLGFNALSQTSISSLSNTSISIVAITISGGTWILGSDNNTWVISLCGTNTWILNNSNNVWVL